MAPLEFDRFAFAPRIRGNGSGALERSPGAVSPTRGGRQHPDHLSFDSGPIFSLSQTPNAESVEKTPDRAHSQEPSTSSEIEFGSRGVCGGPISAYHPGPVRSEEHTSELQSLRHL